MQKKNTKTNIFKRITGTHTRLAVILAVFSILGVVYLIGASANQLDIEYKPTDIIAGTYAHKPTALSRDENTGQLTYDSYSSYNLLLANGSLVCDDGNTIGTVKTGFIPKNRLEKLMSNLEETGINSQTDDTENNADIGNNTQYVLNKGNNSKVVKVDNGKGKPSATVKLQNAIINACRAEAVVTATRDTAPAPTIPVRGKSVVNNDSMATRVANVITPTVDASATANGYNNPDYENRMESLTNAARNFVGKPSIKPSACLKNAARNHAKKMMDGNAIFHSNLGPWVTSFCTYDYWTALAENVGRDSKLGSGRLHEAYLKSYYHKVNMLDLTNIMYNCQAHGVWTNNNNESFHVVLFSRSRTC